MLLEQPDVLLLDEPTNHLDADSVAWLEAFLQVKKKKEFIFILAVSGGGPPYL